MKLQIKAVLAFNFFVAVICAALGVLGYRSADEGFGISLQMKAESNVQSILEIMTYKYPGDWRIMNGTLYKGDEPLADNNAIVDYMGGICKSHVTIFQDDTRIATTVKKTTGERSTGTKASDKVIGEVLHGGKNYTGVADVLGSEYNCAYSPIKDSDGKILGMLFVGLPAQDMDIQKKFITSVIISTLILMAILGVISWIVIGKETQKLGAVSDSLEKVSAGDLRIADLPITSADEFGTLAGALNNMKQKLCSLVKNVAFSAEQVAASSQELTASSAQTADSINQVALNTVNITEEVATQEATIGELQQQIKGMTNEISEIRNDAVAMSKAANASRENAREGRQKVDFAVKQITGIAAQVNKSAQVVRDLGKRSDEIGTIVETIGGIAEQTNLLALNAAIEAARAGEHGRGFAVVAEEVRKLAEQSGIAAKNISELIGEIQRDTNSAVESIEHGNAGVRQGAESVTATGGAFTEIEQQIESLNIAVQASMKSIEAVDATGQKILSAIETIQNLSKQSIYAGSSKRFCRRAGTVRNDTRNFQRLAETCRACRTPSKRSTQIQNLIELQHPQKIPRRVETLGNFFV